MLSTKKMTGIKHKISQVWQWEKNVQMSVHVVVHLGGCFQILDLAWVNSRVWTYTVVASHLHAGFYFLKVGFVAEIFNYPCARLCAVHDILEDIVRFLSWLAHRVFFYNCLNMSIVKRIFVLVNLVKIYLNRRYVDFLKVGSRTPMG